MKAKRSRILGPDCTSPFLNRSRYENSDATSGSGSGLSYGAFKDNVATRFSDKKAGSARPRFSESNHH